MKVINSGSINPFGGLNFVLETFKTLKIDSLINNELPDLAVQSRYTWSDILFTFWSIYFCGGDCIEDCGGNFKRYFTSNPYFNSCSPDRVLSRFKELSLEKIFPTTPRSKQLHEACLNPNLSRLCLKLLRHASLHSKNDLTLDYDNTMLFNYKADSAKTYYKRFAYCPAVAMIGHFIVYVENRNGNSGAHCFQAETLKRMFAHLEEANISINRFRADAASYQYSVFKLLSKEVDSFYIRAKRSADIAETIMNIKEWKEVKVGNEVFYRAETSYTPFKDVARRAKEYDQLKSYRLIVTKCFRADKQIDAFTNEACNYSMILTNDYEMSTDEIVFFYNQRGKAEREFDILKNDFGWKHLPFSKLEQNNVFLIFSAICRNLYELIIKAFSKRYIGLESTYRIKKFIFRFITTPAKWIKQSRQNVLKLYGSINIRADSKIT